MRARVSVLWVNTNIFTLWFPAPFAYSTLQNQSERAYTRTSMEKNISADLFHVINKSYLQLLAMVGSF